MSESSANAKQTGELPVAVRVAARMRRIVDFIGRYAAWLSIPVVVVTCIDVIGRKIAYEAEDGSLLLVRTGAVLTAGEAPACVDRYRGRVVGLEAGRWVSTLCSWTC